MEILKKEAHTILLKEMKHGYIIMTLQMVHRARNGEIKKCHKNLSQEKNQTNMGASGSVIQSSETGRDKHMTYCYPRRQNIETTGPTIIDND